MPARPAQGIRAGWIGPAENRARHGGARSGLDRGRCPRVPGARPVGRARRPGTGERPLRRAVPRWDRPRCRGVPGLGPQRARSDRIRRRARAREMRAAAGRGSQRPAGDPGRGTAGCARPAARERAATAHSSAGALWQPRCGVGAGGRPNCNAARRARCCARAGDGGADRRDPAQRRCAGAAGRRAARGRGCRGHERPDNLARGDIGAGRRSDCRRCCGLVAPAAATQIGLAARLLRAFPGFGILSRRRLHIWRIRFRLVRSQSVEPIGRCTCRPEPSAGRECHGSILEIPELASRGCRPKSGAGGAGRPCAGGPAIHGRRARAEPGTSDGRPTSPAISSTISRGCRVCG